MFSIAKEFELQDPEENLGAQVGGRHINPQGSALSHSARSIGADGPISEGCCYAVALRRAISRSIVPGTLTSISVMFVVALWLLLALQMWVSLKWRLEHDAALLHYAAFLIDQQARIPYKDIFETSMPGTFAFHYAIGHFLGFDDAAFRRVDLACLLVLLGATWTFMRRFGHVPAAAASAMFALLYLSLGQEHSLQRDYVGVLPIAIALTLQPTPPARAMLWKFVTTGLLFGLSTLFKPQLAIGLPVLFWGLTQGSPAPATMRSGPEFRSRAMLRRVASCVAGFAVPWIAATAWLWRHAALGAFVDMAVNYLPLHNGLNGEFVNLSSTEWRWYVATRTLTFGGYAAMLVPAAMGLAFARRLFGPGSALATSVTLLAVLSVVYAVYPTFGGKFWSYHYLPTLFMLSLAAALCAIGPAPTDRHAGMRALAVGALVIPVLFQLDFGDYTGRVVAGLRPTYTAPSPRFGRVDRVGPWLSQHWVQGDLVQPLDWNGGMLHAMLVARVPIATSFTYDYHFYHHVKSPAIQGLRARFMRELRTSPPRFILQVTARKPFVSGVDTASQFPELTNFLLSYRFVEGGDGYRILERRPAAG